MRVEVVEINLDLLIRLFNETFRDSYSTELEGGAVEPYYQPGAPNRVVFRSDYIRSALHEVAHWSLAGASRRIIADYGYWYTSSERDLASQRAFFLVEARPQAIEWLFCDAWQLSFSPSLDNFSSELKGSDVSRFKQRIVTWRQRYMEHGLPKRAALFLSVLESNIPSDLARCSRE